MKVLVIRFSSIGDVVLTTPVLRCLKKQLNAEVHFLTKKTYYGMMSHNPYVDKVHIHSDSLVQTISKLRHENFDIIIDLHNNLRTFIVKTLLFKKSYSYDKLNYKKWLYVNFKTNNLPDLHIVDRYIATCAPLGVQNDYDGLDYYIPPKDELDIKEILPPSFHNGYTAWVIGAKELTKQFPAEKIAHTLSGISSPVVLLGGKEDKNNSKIILTAIHGKDNVFNATAKYSVNQSASLVRQASLVITNDTGLMHIAAAFKKKVISIWGNTVTEFGMSPYYGHHPVPGRVIEVYDLACRPCSKIGHDSCPKRHFKCMEEINEEEIRKAMRELMQT